MEAEIYFTFFLGKVRTLTKSEIDTHSAQLSGRDARGLNVVKSPYLYQDASKFERKPMLSCIDSTMITNNAVGETLVKVRVRKHLQPQVGDKFASLHGQKGVVGMDFHEVVSFSYSFSQYLCSRNCCGQLYICFHAGPTFHISRDNAWLDHESSRDSFQDDHWSALWVFIWQSGSSWRAHYGRHSISWEENGGGEAYLGETWFPSGWKWSHVWRPHWTQNPLSNFYWPHLLPGREVGSNLKASHFQLASFKTTTISLTLASEALGRW